MGTESHRAPHEVEPGTIDPFASSAGGTMPPMSHADVPAATGSLRPAHKDPESIGQYRVIERVGEGGMGVIYRAEQRHPVRRMVALKVIKLGMDTKEVVARFGAERQALAMMDHPNIAKVLDAGMTEQGRPYFAMEYVAGVPLDAYCEQNKLGTKARLDLFISVCNAIQHAHQKGIIHRDLKPSNVLVCMFDARPVPKVIDFGIAKAINAHLAQQTLYTQTGALIGTPEYMSPEQAVTSGLDVDTRTDVYSLGVILYELLTGTTPIDAKALRSLGFEGMARMIRETEPARPSTRLTIVGTEVEGKPENKARSHGDMKALQRELRGDLDWITLKAMEKDRTRRYESAGALAADVRRHLDGEPVLARPPSTSYRLQKFVTKHKVGACAGGCVALAMVVAVVVSVRAERQARRERDSAVAAKAVAEELRQQAEAQRVAAEEAKLDADQAIRALGTSLSFFGDSPETRRKLTELSAKMDGGWLRSYPDVEIATRTMIGFLYLQRQAANEAEPHLLAVLRMTRDERGEYLPSSAPARYGMGIVNMIRRRWPEADRDLAEAAVLFRKSSPPQHGEAAEVLTNQAQVRNAMGDLAGEKKLRFEAQAARADSISQQMDADPKDWRMVMGRGTTRLRLGRFAEAASDLKDVVSRLDSMGKWETSEHWVGYQLGCLSAATGDSAGYARMRRWLLDHYATSDNVAVPERTAKVWLLAPVDDADLPKILGMVDQAVTMSSPNQSLLRWFYLTRAIADYRAGRWEQLPKSVEGARGVDVSGAVTLDLLTAMAAWKAGDRETAKAVYQRATAKYANEGPKPGVDDLANPENYLVYESLRREAEAVFR